MHTHYHLTRLGGLRSLFATQALTSTARGLVGIFVPIYLHQLGFSLAEVFLFFAGFYVSEAVFRFLGPKLLSKLGVHGSMVLGMAGSLSFFLLLAQVASHHWLLWILVPIEGLSSLYWLGFHTTFSASLAHRNVGKVVSLLGLMMLFASSLTPALGGAVATLFGPPALYVAAALLFFLGAITLLAGKSTVKGRPFYWRGVPWRSMKQDLIANSSAGTINNSIELMVWPLFIFLLIPSYIGVGALSAVLVLVSAVITLYVGRREESKGEFHYMRQGAVLYGLTNLIRPVVAGSAGIFGVNLFAGAGKSYMDVAYSSRYYENSRHHPTVEYIAAMELILAIANALFCLLLALLAFSLEDKAVLTIGLLAAVPLSYGINRIR
jgi:MFS family permease